KQMFANTPDLVSSLSVADMPPSYRVVPTRAEDVTAIGDQFKSQPGVKDVVYAKEVISSLLKDFRTKRNGALFIAAGVFAGAVALIVNTIQLAIFARRREVAVMKLVGATNWFIRIPFMLEGLLQGVAGAGIAFGVVWVGRGLIQGRISSARNDIQLFKQFLVTSQDVMGTGIFLLLV